MKEKKSYAFDIDGVICNSKNGDYENSQPILEAIDKINDLYEKGNTIIIFTARFMGRSKNDVKKAHELGYEFTLAQLRRWNVKFDKLYFGKPSFDILIDDKAFNYSDKWITEI